MSPPNKNLKYVHAYKDRHGKIRYYYRRALTQLVESFGNIHLEKITRGDLV